MPSFQEVFGTPLVTVSVGLVGSLQDCGDGSGCLGIVRSVRRVTGICTSWGFATDTL